MTSLIHYLKKIYLLEEEKQTNIKKMSLTDHSFQFKESNTFLAILMYLRLLKEYSSSVKATNLILVASPMNGELKPFTFESDSIDCIDFNVDRDLAKVDYQRYVFIPVVTCSTKDGMLSPAMFYHLYGRQDDFMERVFTEMNNGHFTCIVLDFKEMIACFIDPGYYCYEAVEGEALCGSPESDVDLKQVEIFLNTNASTIAFKRKMYNVQMGLESILTRDPVVSSGFIVKRLNTKQFLQDLVLSRENLDNSGECIPASFVLAEWYIRSGPSSIDKKLLMLHKDQISLQRYVLEYAKEVVENFYPKEVLKIPGAKLEYNDALRNNSEGLKLILSQQLPILFSISGSTMLLVGQEGSDSDYE